MGDINLKREARNRAQANQPKPSHKNKARKGKKLKAAGGYKKSSVCCKAEREERDNARL